MRGPVFLRTGSNPSLTPPPAPPRSEAFPGEASRPSPAAPLGPARARFLDSTGGSRRGWGRGARGGGGHRRERGARGRTGVGSSSLADHTLCEPILSQPLAVSHAGHVQAFVGRASEGEGVRRRREGS